jgi:thiamine pyrophosphate-dependent acetolactate synthase large subunit-like protein
MMPRSQALESIVHLFKDVPCIISVGGTWPEWVKDRPDDGNFGLKTLGSGSSVGLGLALALPHRKILILDGDGAVLMNVNGLLTVGRMQPKNLIHIVIDNRVYECSGRVPTATAHNVDLVAVAKGAGIKSARRVGSIPELIEAARYACSTEGPHFIVADIEVSKTDYGYPHLEEVDNKYRFMRWLEQLEGRKIAEDAIDVKMSIAQSS